MKTFLFIFFAAILFKSAQAQTSQSFITVDSVTYNAYLKGDWNRVISVGNAAIDGGVDYYYLRLRIGYAYFKKESYRKAIPHYEKALKFSSNDPTALEYLYYCYLYSGQENDAEALAAEFPETLKTYLKKESSSKVTSVGFYATYGTGEIDNLKDEIAKTAPVNTSGNQVLTKSLINYNLNASHELGYYVQVHHSLNLLYKDEYALNVNNAVSTLSDLQTVRQFSYHLDLDYTPFDGFTISPLFSYINYSLPANSGMGMNGKGRQASNNLTFNEFAFGLKCVKPLGLFSAALAGVHSDFNQSQQNTGALSLSFYPFGNLNLYYTASGYLHVQNDNVLTQTQFIQSHEIGLKVTDNLWIEGKVTLGEFMNMQDPFSGLIYNGQERYKSIVGVNLIAPFYKSGLSLFVGYRLIHYESVFVPLNNVLETDNAKSLNFQIISGGITWKL